MTPADLRSFLVVCAEFDRVPSSISDSEIVFFSPKAEVVEAGALTPASPEAEHVSEVEMTLLEEGFSPEYVAGVQAFGKPKATNRVSEAAAE